MGMIVAGIPSNRPELCKKAVHAWAATKQFDGIWVMWDSSEICPVGGPFLGFHHDADEPSCIPIGSGCCRSRLVLEAWKNPDIEWLVHLDDDVLPVAAAWRDEVWRLWNADFRWQKVSLSAMPFTRGYPYAIRAEKRFPKIVHGVWTGMPDLDAATQLVTIERDDWDIRVNRMALAWGHYFPMSSMAVAIHRDLFPASYFLWMGKDLPLNKFGDIWCGVILKRICDHFGWLVTSGAPVVYHERASNVWENLRQECKCIEENESWWKWVDSVDIRSCSTVSQCYRQIATQMEMPKTPAFQELRSKMLEWIRLFDVNIAGFAEVTKPDENDMKGENSCRHR